MLKPRLRVATLIAAFLASFATYSQFTVSETTNYISVPSLTRTIDQNKPVYTIPASINVSNGNAQYNVPINIPAGINGMQPNLSIGYNSAGGNGLFGYGWHLGGLSSISRTGDNIVFDGNRYSAELDANDNLAIDGQRLILESGLNLDDASVYKTGMESFQQITKSEQGSGFVVHQKDGLKRYYGQTTASQIEVTNGATSTPIIWLLDLVEDRNGNKTRYHYVKSTPNNEYRLDKISYTENEGVSPRAIIEFHYSNRNDQVNSYKFGNSFLSKYLLESIRSTYDGQEYSEYRFNYTWRTGLTGKDFSRLVEIEYSSLGTDVNSTLIQWNPEQQESSFTSAIYPQYQHGGYGQKVVMDINGDGVDDILSLEYEMIDDGECDVAFDGKPPYNISNWEFQVWGNVKDPSTPYFSRNRVVEPFLSQYKPQNCLRWAFCRIYAGDFNGDLLDDFLVLRSQINGSGNSSSNKYYVDFYINSPSSPGTFTKSKTMQISNHLPIAYDKLDPDSWRDDDDYSANQHPFLLIVNDFDGDGISDISYHGYPTSTEDENWKYASYWNIHFVNSNLTTQFFSVATESKGWGRIDRAGFGDFNGDGKIDPIFLKDGGSVIATGKNRTTWTALYASTFPSLGNFIRTGDFNGDGITDLLYQNAGSYAFKIRHFDGLEFNSTVVDPSISYPVTPTSGWGNPYQTVLDPPIPFVFDADMDGRSDIAFFAPEGGGGGDYTIATYYNKVTGWMPSFTLVPSGLVHVAGDDDFEIVDFDGSGRPSLFYFSNINGGPNYGFLHTYRPSDQSLYVDQILDGYNRLTDFTYGLLTDPAVYSRDVESYPNPSYMGSARVVTNVTVKDFKNLLYKSQGYLYDNLRLNLKGLGMLGYDKVTDLEYIQQKKTETYSNLVPGSSGNTWPFLVTEIKNKLMSGTNISSTKYIYSPTLKKTVGTGFNFEARMLRTEGIDYLHGTSQKMEVNSYDSDGNILSSTSNSYNNTTFTAPYAVQQTTVATYTDEGSWLNWQVDNITKTTTRQGKPSANVVQDFDYDPITGNIQTKTDDPTTDAEVVTSFTYDICGNITSTIITPNAMSPRPNTFTWTNDKRFVKTKTNALTWVTATYTYNDLLGVALDVTDQNTLKTEFTYDDFGRVTRTDFPNNTYSTSTWHWDVAATYGQSLYYIAFAGNNQPDKEVWYNGKNQKIRDKWKNRNNTWVFVQSLYNSKNQLWKKSHPYYNTAQQWTEYAYRPDGRVQTITTPTKTISKTYTGLTTTTTNGATGVAKSQTMDASGLLVSANDDGGTINYTYNSFGKPTQISSASLSSTMSYDDFGRQETLHHPGAGTMKYEYDALGQLISQEDEESNIFTMTYDDLGRVTKKSGPDGDYDYTYDNTLKGYLYEVTSPYQTSTSYGYDGKGRKNYMMEDVQGNQYEFFYNYSNQTGNLETVRYPNDLIIEYVYDSEGRVTTIRKQSDQQLIWEYGDVNVMGQITEFDLGPTSTINRTYDPTSWMLESYVNPGLAEYTYTFDNGTANLTDRANNTYGLEESFAYDDLDRLEAQTFASGGQYLPSGADEISMSYADDGSIESKTDVGTYTNEGGQTHLVEDNPNTISNDQQNITYTPFNSVSTIMEGSFDATFVYGHDNQRRRMKIENAGQTYVERYYLAGGSYERDYKNGDWRNLVYITTPTGQNAVYINDEGQHNHELYLLDLDHLGSIVGISDNSGNLIEEYSYDPWGNRRNPETWENEYNPGQSSNLWSGLLSRGYTGHEHLDCFGLINMNGRIYDPLLGRMLSPDNYVQNVASTQNMNRFSYVLNNPLKYTDPSGEKVEWWHWGVLDILTGGLISTMTITNWSSSLAIAATQAPLAYGAGALGSIGTGDNAWTAGDKRAKNSWDISLGMFKSDGRNSFSEMVSRATWQSPQTMIGLTSGQVVNMIEEVDVDETHGATVISNCNCDGAVTLGSYIIGSSNLQADASNALFQHEYGHYLQSQDFGPWYFSVVGIPSALDKSDPDDVTTADHSFNPAEQDANIRALNYFNKKIPNYTGWDILSNPIVYGLGDHPVKIQIGDVLFGPGAFSGLVNLITYNGRY